MLGLRTAIAICALTAASSIEHGQVKTNLRPSSARHASLVSHDLPGSRKRHAAQATTPAPEAARAEPISAPAPEMVSQEKTPQMAVVQLGRELAEMKERHAHVAQLEQTLASDVSLLRESTMLQRVSTSRRGRAAAQKQVRESERLVKDTEAMVKESRESAMEASRNALREAAEVRKAADALAAEAEKQLQMMGSAHGSHVKPQKKKAASKAPAVSQPAVVSRAAANVQDSSTASAMESSDIADADAPLDASEDIEDAA